MTNQEQEYFVHTDDEVSVVTAERYRVENDLIEFLDGEGLVVLAIPKSRLKRIDRNEDASDIEV